MNASHSSHHASLASRVGGWLPSDRRAVNQWLENAVKEAQSKQAPFHPVVQEFQTMIESDPVMYMYFTEMFKHQPTRTPPVNSGDIKLRNYKEMLLVINYVLGTAPSFNATGMVGFPINAILDFPMISREGIAAFVSPKVNDMFRKVLTAWGQLLDSEASRYVLNESATGWLGTAARTALNFEEIQTDPKAPYLGFKSWNDFFIRQFKPGRRPIAEPEDDTVIVSACESTPFAVRTQAQEFDSFWLKSQPYSLRQMLNGNYIDRFVGGTVYQAFLSADNYHRWHSPVSGTIKKIQQVPGSYYAEAASEGFDEAGPNNSQGYIAHVATRALIFIDADYPGIGLMAVVPIGMAEVSSCRVTVKEGQHVNKGDEIGYFQFGGSTHCLVFRSDVIANFALQAIPQGEHGSKSSMVKVNSFLAKAK